MKWLPYLTLTGSGFMSCLGGGVAGFSQQTGTSSVLLCWHQGWDLRYQRGEAAFLALYLPQPLPWNSTNWTSYTVSPPSSPCVPFFSGAVGAAVPGPQSFLHRGWRHHPPLSWQVGSRVSRESGSLGLSLKKSDLGSMTAPDPGDKCVHVTDKHQIRESTAHFSHH